jgi:hypothetical protein
LSPKDKEALQLPSPHTEQEAPNDKEASPVKVMPPPPSHTINPPPEQDDHPPSSPYDTIHQDIALYKTMSHSDPMNQFFEEMKNLKSPPGTSSAMSANYSCILTIWLHLKTMPRCTILKC